MRHAVFPKWENYGFTGTEATDHSVIDEPMHVIWAVGQEPEKYKHFPLSGLEKGEASVKDFYKPDELKYHGHGDQRGVLSLNFFAGEIMEWLWKTLSVE